ncbi:hypothetical protein X768_03555 [Mesorhizobium sp. LSJC265A00]|nr:hypothetical protein X768_03555 [Mesorhizobium sp. LSJC265A00]ESY06751.1 hypothetical protein X753_08995 [Mesorhizobium sp. LNJC399B00]
MLVEAAGDEAVDAIGNSGNEKSGKGPVPAHVQHRQHQHEAQDGDEVGNGQRHVPPCLFCRSMVEMDCGCKGQR